MRTQEARAERPAYLEHSSEGVVGAIAGERDLVGAEEAAGAGVEQLDGHLVLAGPVDGAVQPIANHKYASVHDKSTEGK